MALEEDSDTLVVTLDFFSANTFSLDKVCAIVLIAIFVCLHAGCRFSGHDMCNCDEG